MWWLLVPALALVGRRRRHIPGLAAVTGAALGAHGWAALTPPPFIGFGAAGAVAPTPLIGGRDRRSHIPLGPAIVAGAIAALLLTGSTPASVALQLGSS